MLLTLVSTKKYGKFILHKCPGQVKTHIKQPITVGQFSDIIFQSYSYFGLFQSKCVLATSDQAELSQSLLTQTLFANEKHTQLLMAIDDCVFASRSAFMKNRKENIQKKNKSSEPIKQIQNSLGKFIEMQNQKQSIVQSISVVWCGKNFNEVESIKHQISFLLGVLEHRQQNQEYLSLQISKIMEIKTYLRKKIKQKCAQFSKQEITIIEPKRANQILLQIENLVKDQIQNIELFRFLDKFHSSIVNREGFEVKDLAWLGTMNSTLKIIQYPNYFDPQRQKSNEKLLNKTIITMEQKLQRFLPPSLYGDEERIKKLYEKVFKDNSISLKEALKRENGEIFKDSLLYTANFLLQNELAISVYPFDKNKYFHYYCLRSLPSDDQIQKKFNKIFFNQQKSEQNKDEEDEIESSKMLEFIKKYGLGKQLRQFDEKFKYMAFKKILSQMKIYIYRYSLQNKSLVQANLSRIEEILSNYANKNIQVNEILYSEPELKKGELNDFIKPLKEKKELERKYQWHFYFIQ